MWLWDHNHICCKSYRSSIVRLLLCWLTGHSCQKPMSFDHTLRWSHNCLNLCCMHIVGVACSEISLEKSYTFQETLTCKTYISASYIYLSCVIILLRFYRPWFIITWDLSLLNQYQSFQHCSSTLWICRWHYLHPIWCLFNFPLYWLRC